MNASSIFLFSLADVSITNNTSGIYSQVDSASENSTSLSSSKSHLLPINTSNEVDAVYLRTSSIHLWILMNEDLLVTSYTSIIPFADL